MSQTCEDMPITASEGDAQKSLKRKLADHTGTNDVMTAAQRNEAKFKPRVNRAVGKSCCLFACIYSPTVESRV